MEGTVLASKYALRSKLGQGGMGSVWRAEHLQLRSPVAIKLIDQEIARNPEALARFMREAQAAAALRSPHVVQIFDFGADEGVPYIAMELLEGESLAGRLERTRVLSPSETAHIVTQISRAVTKAHDAGIVHRDLKPDNVFLVRNDEEEVAKVLDFGIAKAPNAFGASTGSATRTGSLLGTPYYMSPEQAEGNRHVDGRADLWALGVIAYECLVGRRPFEADALGALLLAICTRPMPIPSKHAPVPQGFDVWFAHACAREPNERFQSARELALELRRVCGEAGTAPHSYSSEPTLNLNVTPPSMSLGGTPPAVERPLTANTYERSVHIERPRVSRAPLVLGGAVAMAAIAGVAYFVMRQPSTPSSADTTQSAGPIEPALPSVAAVGSESTSAPTPPSANAPAPALSSAPSVFPAASPSPPPPSRTARPKAPLAKPRTKPPARSTATSKTPVDLGL